MGLREMLGIGRTNVVGVVTRSAYMLVGKDLPKDVTIMEIDPVHPHNTKNKEPRYCGVFGKKPVRVGSLIVYTVGPVIAEDGGNGRKYETASNARVIGGPFDAQNLRTRLSVLSD